MCNALLCRGGGDRERRVAAPRVAWSSDAVDAAEAAVFAALAPGLQYSKRAAPVAGGFVNAITAGPAGAPPLLLLHGWGAGAALFARNMAALSAAHRVHALDWLGFGASARPPFDLAAGAAEAEAFFLDALEEYVDGMRARGELGARLHVVGHSMGAFLAVGYALRRPGDVINLVLASPVGVPRAPANKFPPRGAPLRKRLLFWLVFTLWDRHWTPQLFVRYAPTERLGRLLAAWAMAPRFPTDDAAARAAIDDYFYQTCVAPASAEHSLSTLLESGAYAREPLVDKLPRVHAPTLFMYGTRDWMDWAGGDAARKTMPAETDLVRVENAGHHLYYDNPDAFGEQVVRACQAAAAASAEKAKSRSCAIRTSEKP